MPRLRFRRPSTDISYRCRLGTGGRWTRGRKEGREETGKENPASSRRIVVYWHVKYRYRTLRNRRAPPFYPLSSGVAAAGLVSLSRNDPDQPRAAGECYVCARFAIMRVSCMRARGCALLCHRDISITLSGHRRSVERACVRAFAYVRRFHVPARIHARARAHTIVPLEPLSFASFDRESPALAY